jgi:hypothetical protein
MEYPFPGKALLSNGRENCHKTKAICDEMKTFFLE